MKSFECYSTEPLGGVKICYRSENGPNADRSRAHNHNQKQVILWRVTVHMQKNNKNLIRHFEYLFIFWKFLIFRLLTKCVWERSDINRAPYAYLTNTPLTQYAKNVIEFIIFQAHTETGWTSSSLDKFVAAAMNQQDAANPMCPLLTTLQ